MNAPLVYHHSGAAMFYRTDPNIVKRSSSPPDATMEDRALFSELGDMLPVWGELPAVAATGNDPGFPDRSILRHCRDTNGASDTPETRGRAPRPEHATARLGLQRHA